MAQTTQVLSLKAFADACGVKYQTVQGWIKKDKLTRGCGLVKPVGSKFVKVRFHKACKELLDNIDLTQAASEQLFERLNILIGKKIEPKKQENNPNRDGEDEVVGVSFAEARRINENLKAETAQVVLDEKKKILVNAEAVKKKFYSYGVEIRTALEGVPAKVIDNVLASETRNEGLLIIKSAIAQALQKIHDIEKRKL